MSNCLTDSQVDHYARETSGPEERREMDLHLEECPACRRRVFDMEYQALLETAGGSERLTVNAADVGPTGAVRVGHYRLLSELGCGGQGRVYLAEDTRGGGTVALKVLRGQIPLGGEVYLRFQREASALRKLEHPGICQVHDAGEVGGVPYIAMRYIEGESLAAWIDREAESGDVAARESVQRFTDIFERAARALHAAHEAGLVHRDIKPGNIMITSGGEPVLLDFGLVHDEGGDSASLTRTGAILGTPAYMSPEQIAPRGERIDRRTDIYSLGVTLYEALTLRLPFNAPTIPEIYRKILTESAADPSRLNPFIARDLRVIIATAMEKEPARRYQTALDLAEDLRRYSLGRRIRARPAGTVLRLARWARRNPAVASLLAAVFLILVSALVVSLGLLSRVRSEKAARDVVLTHLEIRRADQFIESGSSFLGIASLSRILRLDPENRIAAERLVSTLSHRSFAVAAAPPLRHEGPVFAAEFSPDGRFVLTASADGTARLWDAATGQPSGEPMRHAGEVHRALFSRDGKLAATVSNDHTARIWDARTGKPLTEPLRHDDLVVHACFSADGRLLATTSWDRTARIWETRSGRQVGSSIPLEHRGRWVDLDATGSRLLTAADDSTAKVWTLAFQGRFPVVSHHSGTVNWSVFTPDGTGVLTGANDGGLRRIDSLLGLHSAEAKVHTAPIAEGAVSPDGARVVTASWDGTARLWDARTLSPLGPGPVKHGGPVNSVSFSPDGLRFATASEDSTARVWDAGTLEPVVEPMRHGNWVWQVRFSPDGERVVTASMDGTARIWSLRCAREIPSRLNHGAWVIGAEFSPDGGRLVTCSLDRTARVWDARGATPLFPPLSHGDEVVAAHFNSDGSRLVTASWDKTARVFDAHTGASLLEPLRHDAPVVAAAFLPGARSIVTASRDGRIRVWDAGTGAMLRPLIVSPEPILGMDVSADGSRVAVAGLPNHVRLWELANGALMFESTHHGAEITEVRFSPAGNLIASASKDNTATIVDARSGKVAVPPLKHHNWILCVAFSPDGTQIATGSADRTARVWRTSTGEPLTEPMQHPGRVCAVRYSASGARLLTASDDGTCRLWDPESGLPLTDPLLHPGGVATAALSPDSARVASAGLDGTALLWEAPVPPLPVPAWLPGLVEELSGSSLDLERSEGAPDPVDPRRAAGKLALPPDSGYYDRWARWLLAGDGDRAVASSSEVLERDYVEQVVEEDSLKGLEALCALQPPKPGLIAGLARLRLEEAEQKKTGEEAARWLIEYALSATPSDPDCAWARAEVLRRDGRLEEAVACMRPGAASETNPQWWLAWAALLEADGKLEEALEACSRIGLLGKEGRQEIDQARTQALLRRAALLRRLGRSDQALADFLKAKRISSRDGRAGPAQIDLTRYYNAGLEESWYLGRDSVRSTFASLPVGLVELGWVGFDVRGVIQVGGAPGTPLASFAKEVLGIDVSRKCRRLHFLHAWSGALEATGRIGSYWVRFRSGESREIPLFDGKNILPASWSPWRFRPECPGAMVAWTGTNPSCRSRDTAIWLYRSSWENPLPEDEVASIDLVSALAPAAPFLVALTVE